MENFSYERPVVWKLFREIFVSQYCWNYKCILSELSSVDLTLNKEYAECLNLLVISLPWQRLHMKLNFQQRPKICIYDIHQATKFGP